MKPKSKVQLPSTAVGRRRLLKLAGMLEADAKNKNGIKFDLSLWGGAHRPDEPMSCATIGCAMGLAVASGAFAKDGLQPPDSGGRLAPVFRSKGSQDRLYHFDAAAGLFQIERQEAKFLFGYNHYSLPRSVGAHAERAVAKRIRQFVAGKVAP
ncbi:MAG TPA: hypothetical protein VLJ17_15140 [Xanthobacteraceae bacterium]|nr:hypothetical protein [Xanthobacteraceae bacterium]